MAFLAYAPSKSPQVFVHEISVDDKLLACEEAPDWVKGGEKKNQAGGGNREWSGEEKTRLARFAHLIFFCARWEPVHRLISSLSAREIS